MLVTIEKRIPIEQGFDAIRNATLENAGDEKIYFYKEAELRLAYFTPEELSPVALYLLEEHLKVQRELRHILLEEYGIDTLHLREILHLHTEKGLEAMIPPYVEISEEVVKLVAKDGDREPGDSTRIKVTIPILPDGLHRAYLAQEVGETLTCVVASGMDTISYPYASYPVSWSDVKVYQEVPPVKKFYRRQEKYSFMRPLDALRLLKPVKVEYGRK